MPSLPPAISKSGRGGDQSTTSIAGGSTMLASAAQALSLRLERTLEFAGGLLLATVTLSVVLTRPVSL
ncbi:hypothetical protein D3C71_2116450 [compost metagenome]